MTALDWLVPGWLSPGWLAVGWLAVALAVAVAVATVVRNRLALRRAILRLHAMLDSAIAGNFCEHNFDESELSALEQKLHQYLTTQETARRTLDAERARTASLIADISHQTKTPVANILLYAQLLSEQPLPDELHPQLAALCQQSEKLRFLVESLVKASRLESGIIEVYPQRQPLAELLEAVAAQAAPAAEAAGVTLTVQPTGASATFDAKWTAEAVWNLVDNAIKYTPAGGSVTLSVQLYELFARLEVADTGIGIADNEQARVFGRFYRSQQVTAQPGVGLGLYLAREIVTMQGGYIKLGSVPGQGSSFSVFLPV